MAILIYSGITSLDGYTADADGNFAWAAPDEQLHAVVNDLERSTGTYLYGRRMYEVMSYWQSAPTAAPPSHGSAAAYDYAGIWQAADKIVYSTTLESASTPRTKLERVFDPQAIRQLKAAANSPLSLGGPNLAAQALAAGLVDEVHQFITPVIVGGGTRFLPDGLHLNLELLDHHRFDSGVVHLHYRTRT